VEQAEPKEGAGAARWSRSDWRVAAGIALLLAAAPGATLVGAWALRPAAEAEAAAIEPRARPRMTAERDAARGREALRALLRRPTLGAVIDRLAAVLPEGARLARAERGSDGALMLEVATPDPDELRRALRREPLLAGLRDRGQRQSEGGMIVTLASAP
jgi:hypothetical protein